MIEGKTGYVRILFTDYVKKYIDSNDYVRALRSKGTLCRNLRDASHYMSTFPLLNPNALDPKFKENLQGLQSLVIFIRELERY